MYDKLDLNKLSFQQLLLLPQTEEVEEVFDCKIREMNADSIKQQVIGAELNSEQVGLVQNFIDSVKALDEGMASWNENYRFFKDSRLKDLESQVLELLVQKHYRLLAQSIFEDNGGILVDVVYQKYEYFVGETPGQSEKDLKYFIMLRAEKKEVIKDIEAYNELDKEEKIYWEYVAEFGRYVYDYYKTF